jgi:hypothetical protein
MLETVQPLICAAPSPELSAPELEDANAETGKRTAPRNRRKAKSLTRFLMMPGFYAPKNPGAWGETCKTYGKTTPFVYV